MSEFLLLFRRDYKTGEIQPPLEILEENMIQWEVFFARIQDKLVRPVKGLDPVGQIITSNKDVAVGPYAEINQSLSGFIIIEAAGYEEAVMIAKNCPILEIGGTVEIRREV
jgi:hypothetical protein